MLVTLHFLQRGVNDSLVVNYFHNGLVRTCLHETHVDLAILDFNI